MNYGRKGIREQQLALNAKGPKWAHKILLTLAVVACVAIIGVGIIGAALGIGAFSGIVEPIGGALVLLMATSILGIMPYMLSFAAGAMLYVVVEELIPEYSQGRHSNIGTIGFALGFELMMALDVVLA